MGKSLNSHGFQFNITNTLPDTVLENVSVIMTPSEDTPLTEDFIIPHPLLTSEVPGVVYVSFSRNTPEEYALGAFSCTLKFVSKEVDPSSGEPEAEGYDDEYQIEELDLGAGDVSLQYSLATDISHPFFAFLVHLTELCQL